MSEAGAARSPKRSQAEPFAAEEARRTGTASVSQCYLYESALVTGTFMP